MAFNGKHSGFAKSKISAAHKGRTFSVTHKAAISAALKGRVLEKKYERTCACGKVFKTGARNALFCSKRCRRAAHGHGLRHAPSFAHFVQQCSICDTKEDLVGDHDHNTGLARGILCRNCNLALGNIRDNPILLRKAAIYIEYQQHKEKSYYLSGPMSGYKDHNIPAFMCAYRDLTSAGYNIKLPADLGESVAWPENSTWIDYLAADIKIVDKTDGIIFLPQWWSSRGARLEAFTALLCGKQLFMQYFPNIGKLYPLDISYVKFVISDSL